MEEKEIQRLVLAGDLFHSKRGESREELKQFLDRITTKTILCLGNHDPVSAQFYQDLPLEICQTYSLTKEIAVVHEEMEDLAQPQICGHRHPGFRLPTKVGKSIILPCFHQKSRYLFLPSFGDYTGQKAYPVEKQDRLFVITENSVNEIKISPSTN